MGLVRRNALEPDPWRRLLRRLASKRSVIVCHHGVGSSSLEHDPLFLRVPPARLRRQLELLDDAGFEFRTVADLMREADGGPPPPGRLALSFDDGMHDNHAEALPLLRELGVPATFYITTGLIGKPNPFMPAAAGARMMNAGELRELHDAGMELGAHTITHPDLSELDPEACRAEIGGSRDALEAATGVRAVTFAYPYGSYGPAAYAAARELGFEAAVTCNGHGDRADRYAMPRSLLWGRDRLPSFAAKLFEVWDPFFAHPAVRFGRVHTRGVRRRGRALLARDGRH
jgi:peptidoglycan/xylan/chitin deacetylase (PgdA/CDA1 family)